MTPVNKPDSAMASNSTSDYLALDLLEMLLAVPGNQFPGLLQLVFIRYLQGHLQGKWIVFRTNAI